MNILYNRIQLLCEQKKISGGKLCSDIGIRRSLLTDLKMGRKRTLAAETLSKIASYFNVSIDYLLGNLDTKKEPITSKDDELSELIKDPKLKELYDLLVNLPEDQLDDLVKYAEFLTLKQKADEKK